MVAAMLLLLEVLLEMLQVMVLLLGLLVMVLQTVGVVLVTVQCVVLRLMLVLVQVMLVLVVRRVMVGVRTPDDELVIGKRLLVLEIFPVHCLLFPEGFLQRMVQTLPEPVRQQQHERYERHRASEHRSYDGLLPGVILCARKVAGPK